MLDSRGRSALSFDSLSLVPSTWLQEKPDQEFHVYNPGIARVGQSLLMAYRVDSGRYPHFKRRIGICLLDAQLRLIPESVQPFSDTVQEGGERFYDPRFVQMGERLFIHYNNSTFTQPNHLYLVEVDLDTLCARGPARRLALEGPRQEIEKNWMFFSPDGEALWAVYWIQPHKILRVELEQGAWGEAAGSGAIVCRVDSVTPWEVAGVGRPRAIYSVSAGRSGARRRYSLAISICRFFTRDARSARSAVSDRFGPKSG